MNKSMAQWAIVGYVLTLAMYATGIITNEINGVSPNNTMANVTLFMDTHLCPLIAIVVFLLPYTIITKRWYTLFGGIIGIIAFSPVTISWAVMIFFAVLLPVNAWQEGWHVGVIVLAIAYCVLAFLLTRLWLRRKRSQQENP